MNQSLRVHQESSVCQSFVYTPGVRWDSGGTGPPECRVSVTLWGPDNEGHKPFSSSDIILIYLCDMNAAVHPNRLIG